VGYLLADKYKMRREVREKEVHRRGPVWHNPHLQSPVLFTSKLPIFNLGNLECLHKVLRWRNAAAPAIEDRPREMLRFL